MSLLPERLDSLEARAMLYAIAMQESRLQYRRQINGPARGFWQFEQGGGVRGVVQHPATRPLLLPVLKRLRYEPVVPMPYAALADNDILAAVFARLLLWTVPQALPGPDDAEEGWKQYLWAWRPGKPHRHTWDGFYGEGWAACRI
jgi:hypothetical protein